MAKNVRIPAVVDLVESDPCRDKIIDQLDVISAIIGARVAWKEFVLEVAKGATIKKSAQFHAIYEQRVVELLVLLGVREAE